MPTAAYALPRVSVADLFWGFLRVGIRGFGGAMPWVRRMLVEEHRWLTAQAFTDTLSVCQILPGPNVVNVSVVVGARFQGGPGAVAAVTGLLSVPFLVVLVLGVLYARLGHAPAVDRLLRGLGPAAVALVLATGLKMAAPLVREPRALVFLVAAFVAVGLLRWPLVPVLLGLAPLSVVAAWMARR